jgi:hypothetical protein
MTQNNAEPVKDESEECEEKPPTPSEDTCDKCGCKKYTLIFNFN